MASPRWSLEPPRALHERAQEALQGRSGLRCCPLQNLSSLGEQALKALPARQPSGQLHEVELVAVCEEEHLLPGRYRKGFVIGNIDALTIQRLLRSCNRFYNR